MNDNENRNHQMLVRAQQFLASRESEFVTGINLQLDGGSSSARALTLG